jgi:hypothetical protein
MKRYIVLTDMQSDDNEVEIKVEPLYVMEDRNEDIFAQYLDEYTPSKGDKLYFLPGVNVPRIKLKDLALQHGIRTVRNIEDATHIFAAKNTKDKITSGTWRYSLDLKDFNAIMEDENIYIDDRYRENIRQVLEFNTEDKVLFSYSELNDIKHGNNEALKLYGDKINSSTWYNTIDEEHSDLALKMIGATVYDEMAILKHINGDDATVIDEAMFDQISDMFKSNDKDNHVLAMEIMANSNYTESLLFLEMLFKEFSGRISDTHTKNHVNFKSLIGFLKKNKNYLGTDLDDVVNSLLDKDTVSKDMMDTLMKKYSHEIANSGDTDHFKVKIITLSDELKAKLNIDYEYQHVDDFIPEVPEDNSPGVEGVEEEIEIANEDIEADLTILEPTEAVSELIVLEEEKLDPVLETNNNQIKQDDTDFDWF